MRLHLGQLPVWVRARHGVHLEPAICSTRSCQKPLIARSVQYTGTMSTGTQARQPSCSVGARLGHSCRRYLGVRRAGNICVLSSFRRKCNGLHRPLLGFALWHRSIMKLSTAERCACLPDLRTLPVWLQSNAGPPTGQAYPLYRIRGPHELEPVTLRVGGEVQDLQVT
jgi:hypothetical protein